MVDIFEAFDKALAQKMQSNERGKPWWDYFEDYLHKQGKNFDYIGKGLWVVDGCIMLHEDGHDG